MKVLSVQIALILGVLVLVRRLLSGRGQRTIAVRRLGFVAFAALAILSILFPSFWTAFAHLVGVGRGTDLILYGLVVAFFSSVVTQFRRSREMEIRYTRLARRIALDEAPPPSHRPDGAGEAPDAR